MCRVAVRKSVSVIHYLNNTLIRMHHGNYFYLRLFLHLLCCPCRTAGIFHKINQCFRNALSVCINLCVLILTVKGQFTVCLYCLSDIFKQT